MKPIPLTLGEVANFGIAKLLFYVNMSAPNTHYTLPPLLWKLFGAITIGALHISIVE